LLILTFVAMSTEQKDITNFRLKQAVLLVNAPLNKEKVSPGYHQSESNIQYSQEEDLLRIHMKTCNFLCNEMFRHYSSYVLLYICK
jgi:hypothetical protein